jgi:hypothetical protein
MTTISRAQWCDMHSLWQATLAARQRLNDATIATRVESGKLQIGRVAYPAGKTVGVFTPLTEWLTIKDAIRALAALQ